jgi:hypothetical protein
MSILKNFDPYWPYEVFIETGYGSGDTLQFAAAKEPPFHSLHSVEILAPVVAAARARWSGDPRVTIHHGHSPEVLARILEPERPTLIWLDAHYSGGLYGAEPRPERECPLLEELHVVLAQPWRVPPAILVDDAPMFLSERWWANSPYAGLFTRAAWPTRREIATATRGWGILDCGAYFELRKGWQDETSPDTVPAHGGEVPRGSESLEVYTWGCPLQFCDPGSRAFLGHGWSTTESWGTWSNDTVSAIYLRLPGIPPAGLILSVSALGYAPGGRPDQQVRVFANGAPVGTWRLPHLRIVEVTAEIPPTLAAGHLLQLTCAIPNALSPRSVLDGDDSRLLGMGLISLRLDPRA